MKYKLMIAAAAMGAVVALSAPAYAQDLSGFRIEARGGWNQSSTDLSLPNPDYDEDNDEPIDEFLTASETESDIAYGAEIGYDFQIPYGPVLGVYAGVDFAGGETCAELIEDDLACAGIDRTITLGARAGLPLGETSMIFVKGGYSNGKFAATYDEDVTDNDDADAGDIFEFDEDLGGWHAGGGLEFGLTRRLYAKLEYTYTSYGSQEYRPDGADEDSDALEIGTDRHLVVAGVGLRF
ncbi:MAG: hypothetical protein B7Z08_06865 [Sphingomonadales bacterium 32-68-7]|nr:MAG: hypothetical protein B7Z33_10720 [Sphingomonadales bacterium 12-68-11]OYX09047.1 MAG: hypothetical protein B7Z08_06865 [Sphingomonadales bacterium 32-68-7]